MTPQSTEAPAVTRKTKKTLPLAAWMPRPEDPAAITRVTVTAEDIAAGTHEVDSCPVALALKRDAGLADPWVIGGAYRVVGWNYNWKLPTAVWAWVRRFDAGKTVEPFAFDWWAVS